MELSENKINNEFNIQNVGNLIYNLENIKKNLEEILNLKQRNKEISEIIDIIKEFLSWINPFMDKDHKKTKEDLEKREGFIKKVKDKLGNYFKNNPEIKNLVEITNLINKSKEILLFLDDNIDFNPSENDIENKSINLGIEEDNPFFSMGERSFEEKDNEIKKQIEENDKKITELANKNEKENNNYVKKIRDLTNQLNTANTELNELKSKNSAVTLDEMLDDPSSLLEDQLDECKKTIEKLKEEIRYYEKQIESMNKDNSKAKKFDELEAKNKFLNDTIESMNKNIEELKKQKQKAEEDFKLEITRVETELGQTKCELANTVYDKEATETKYKKYIDKLKNKLSTMGFKFKPKKPK